MRSRRLGCGAHLRRGGEAGLLLVRHTREGCGGVADREDAGVAGHAQRRVGRRHAALVRREREALLLVRRRRLRPCTRTDPALPLSMYRGPPGYAQMRQQQPPPFRHAPSGIDPLL